MASTDIHTPLELHWTSEKFYIEGGNEVLVIDRVGNEIRLEERASIPAQAERRGIVGLVGTIRLVSGPYLVVITEATRIGEINGHLIWELRKAQAIPFTRTTLHLTETQVNENRALLSRLESFLATPGFYFSYTLDLTHSLQRLQNTTPDFLQTPMHERADQRFLWNRHALYEFTLHPECHRFALPLMHGFIGIRDVAIGSEKFKLTLISRRSWLRAGTRSDFTIQASYLNPVLILRFFMRGVDNQGHTANFVETEEVIEYKNTLASYVQCRGSIPLYWSQKPNLKWQPQPLLKGDEQASGFKAHLTQLQGQYPGLIVLVNLINSKGREATMAKALAGVVQAAALANVKYEYFDFHKECAKLNWETGLERLRVQLSVHTPGFGFFASPREPGGEPVLQAGFFRTNCMDSLDRTNVVQALLAKQSLASQLLYLRIIPQGASISQYPAFESVFKNLWADNADACSIQYAGTGALKTDFTRYGTRTYQGCFQDLVNALTRYMKNNFWDGARQDGIDLFVGNYVVEGQNQRTMVCGSVEEWKDWRGLVLLSLVFALTMMLLCFLLATEHTFSFLLFWGALSTALLTVIALNGEDFVNKPKLKID